MIGGSHSVIELSRNGKLLGMISTHWEVPHEPSARDLRILDILPRQAADLLDRTIAKEERRRLMNRWKLAEDSGHGFLLLQKLYSVEELPCILQDIGSMRHLWARSKAPSICLMQDRRGKEPGHWRSPPWPVRTCREFLKKGMLAQDLRPFAMLRWAVTMGTSLVANSFNEGTSPLAE